ncbi:hypothetical protein [Streptomyces lonarensis]|uniref:Uncharacterized protein n=1 Tax=Streptomyces lonarensis TaxID=700599 RepID=A0A7X6D2T5_9ACTN|nr:hypothetical protein [Streptomyces lonarensis]NJQ07161.1 hypothetical protein [Streptomyces lonarensis]
MAENATRREPVGREPGRGPRPAGRAALFLLLLWLALITFAAQAVVEGRTVADQVGSHTDGVRLAAVGVSLVVLPLVASGPASALVPRGADARPRGVAHRCRLLAVHVVVTLVALAVLTLLVALAVGGAALSELPAATAELLFGMEGAAALALLAAHALLSPAVWQPLRFARDART